MQNSSEERLSCANLLVGSLKKSAINCGDFNASVSFADVQQEPADERIKKKGIKKEIAIKY